MSKHTPEPPLCLNCVEVASLAAEIARLKAREAEMRKAMQEMSDAYPYDVYACFAKKPGGPCSQCIAMDKMRALLARESAEPAEERGPELGDIVMYDWDNPDERVPCEWDETMVELGSGLSSVNPPRFRVLMRRAEVEARMKGEGK
jgi:hypothetical protein